MTKKTKTPDTLSPEVEMTLERIRRQIDQGTTEDQVLVLSEIVSGEGHSLSHNSPAKPLGKAENEVASRFLTRSDLHAYLEERLPNLVADLVRQELSKKKDL